MYIYTPLYWHWYPINMSTWPRGEFSKTRHNSRCVTLATLGMAQVLKYCHLVGGPMVKTMVFPMVNIPNYISGWWFYITILKNDRVRRWEGWHPKYMKWKIKAMFETTSQSCLATTGGPITKSCNFLVTGLAMRSLPRPGKHSQFANCLLWPIDAIEIDVLPMKKWWCSI